MIFVNKNRFFVILWFNKKYVHTWNVCALTRILLFDSSGTNPVHIKRILFGFNLLAMSPNVPMSSLHEF